jgi:hypothetical protein
VFLASELLVPLGVSVDVRRRGGDVDPVWVHAAALPLVNVVGLLAYLEDRRRGASE